MELAQIIENKLRIGLPSEAKKVLRFEETEITVPVISSFWNETSRPKTMTVYIVRKKKK